MSIMHYQAVNDDLLDGRFEFRQSGSFRELSIGATAKIIVSAVIEPILVFMSISAVIGGLFGSLHTISNIVIMIALAVILPILPIWYILWVSGGERQYRYEANDKTMRIYNKRRTYIFRYCDVRNVEYRPLTLIFRKVGYTVTVTSKYETVIFRYMTPRKAEFTDTASTPFSILERARMKTQDKSDRF